MYFSLDTVKLVMPVCPDWHDTIREFFTRTDAWHWCKYNPSSGEVSLLNLAAKIKPKSWHKGLYLSLRDQIGFGLSIVAEFSLPKIAYGNNVGLLPWWRSDLLKVAGAIERYLVVSSDPGEDMSKPLFPDIDSWGILRVDIAWAWKTASDQKARAVLDSLKRFRFKWRKPVVYDSGIHYPSKSSPCKFYLKGEEFRKHDLKSLSEDTDCVDQKAVEQVQRQSQGIVRFEVTLRGRALRDLGIGVVSDLDACDLGEVLRSYLDRCTGMDGVYLTEANIAEQLSSAYSKAKTARLLDFCRLVSTENENFAIRRYGSDAYYRNRRDLRAVLGESGLADITYEFDGRDSFKFDTHLMHPEMRMISVFEHDPF